MSGFFPPSAAFGAEPATQRFDSRVRTPVGRSNAADCRAHRSPPRQNGREPRSAVRRRKPSKSPVARESSPLDERSTRTGACVEKTPGAPRTSGRTSLWLSPPVTAVEMIESGAAPVDRPGERDPADRPLHAGPPASSWLQRGDRPSPTSSREPGERHCAAERCRRSSRPPCAGEPTKNESVGHEEHDGHRGERAKERRLERTSLPRAGDCRPLADFAAPAARARARQGADHQVGEKTSAKIGSTVSAELRAGGRTKST